MDRREIERIRQLAEIDAELARLWGEHQALEAELADLDGRRHRTPSEEQQRKQLQKSKLAGRDRIEIILDRHR